MGRTYTRKSVVLSYIHIVFKLIYTYTHILVIQKLKTFSQNNKPKSLLDEF